MASPASIIIIFSAFGGFLLAFYIIRKKGRSEKLVCPLDSDCEAVIHSEYSKFFGVPVEILGLFYYGAVVISYLLFSAFPVALATPTAVFAVLTLTTAAFIFSLYLTFIQAFAIKQWCAWCLMSAGLCAIIFSSAVSASELGFIPLLAGHKTAIALIHGLGVALGLGGATIADILFFKFLKDLRISEWEADVLHVLSQVIWFALAVLVLSGAALYLPEAEELNQSPKFLVKAIVAAVIIANGSLLNLLVAPKLVKISFGQEHDHAAGELRQLRKAAFVLGAVSLASWYSAFLLGAVQEISIGFGPLFLAYLALIGAAVAAGRIMERWFANRPAQ